MLSIARTSRTSKRLFVAHHPTKPSRQRSMRLMHSITLRRPPLPHWGPRAWKHSSTSNRSRAMRAHALSICMTRSRFSVN
ncbi:uncharacterized protein LY79DRAFT_551412 [Colletotrichum navitas]|uniref:Uncharacterized protein n=1 Tax=Colletotrichum navitas TaxID=681940 RepID=A0AAD8Q0S3_9PEZI|nr:uncharacterized protein LY79DRAFT_551412 [Colletotrichum navitas]KAK1593618.1 hypothetical protein LY79DRAFT_551412 [Colletotrichum navitas]